MGGHTSYFFIMIFSSTMKLWPRWWLYYCKNTIWYWMSDQSMEQHTSCHRFSVVSQMTDHARLRCIPSLSLLGEQVQNFQLQYDESVTQMVIWQWKKRSQSDLEWVIRQWNNTLVAIDFLWLCQDDWSCPT